MATDPNQVPIPRRRFLAKTVAAATGLLAAFVGAGYFVLPWRRWTGSSASQSKFQAIGTVESLPVGKWHSVSFDTVDQHWWNKTVRRHSVWVRRDKAAPDAIRVLSPICPHGGCSINWVPSKSAFICPCHGGTFEADGKRRLGPPRRSMDPVEFRVEGGQLLVRWQDYKLGAAEQIPLDPPAA